MSLDDLQAAVSQFDDWQHPWTFHDAVAFRLSSTEKDQFETIWRAVARRRAAERGFSTVGDYLAELIRQDAAGKPAKANALPRTHQAPAKRQRRESVSTIRKRLLDGMFSYMKASEDPGYGYTCGYTLKHIDRCAAITRDFLERISAVPRADKEKIVAEVKRVVVKLNKLNASCDQA